MAAIPIGVLDFGEIGINLAEFVTPLGEFLTRGSRANSLVLNDINLQCSSNPAPANYATLAAALADGCHLFDTLINFQLPVAQRVAPVHDGTGAPAARADLANISRALFFQAFMIVVRGSASTAPGNAAGADVPAILQNVLSLNESPLHYANMLASFDVRRVDPAWVRHINFGPMGREVLTRLGLGVAGYRNFAPFKLYPCMPLAPPDVQQSYAVANYIATQPADWQIHPATRNPAILTTYGPLNSNLANLMLVCFTPAQLAEMVAQRIIYQMPVHDPRAHNYLQWGVVGNPVLNQPMF